MACNQETYWQRKSEHRCVICNQQDERTLAGKAYCAQCTEKRSIREHLRTTDEQKRRVQEYWQRKSEHRCVKCNQQDDRTLAGKAYCAQCTEKRSIREHFRTDEQKCQHAEYNRLTYEWCKQKHICVKCGRKDARTISGMTHCKMCAAKDSRAKRKYRMEHPLTEEQKVHHTVQKRELYQKRKETGLCTKCGKHKADRGFTTCIDCRLKNRERASMCAARNHPGRQGNGLTRREWKELGICARCGNVLDGQLNKDGKPSKLCRKCYATAYGKRT